MNIITAIEAREIMNNRLNASTLTARLNFAITRAAAKGRGGCSMSVEDEGFTAYMAAAEVLVEAGFKVEFTDRLAKLLYVSEVSMDMDIRTINVSF
jgi:hypothetical protein